MGGASEGSSKRRRRNDEYPKLTTLRSSRRKKHLYLVLDDWSGGYSIHRIDADDILDQGSGGGGDHHKLPEPAALRIASRSSCPMAFAALGTDIFAATNPLSRGDRRPPTLVYDTKTAALTFGPHLPDWIFDLGAAMAVGGTLYGFTFPPFDEPSALQALSWVPIPDLSPDLPAREPWDPTMEWRWNTVPSPQQPVFDRTDIITYAVHPDGRTVFISTGCNTYAWDTGNGTWKELGYWVLPFRGQAFFDGDLDAWVGLHRNKNGWVCCCPVASRSATTTRQPECRMLTEKLVRRKEENPEPWPRLINKVTSLTYMGDSRYAFFENVPSSDDFRDGSVIHMTLFGLKYDHKGELTTKVRHATRSYAVSKNTSWFSHAVFWM